MAELVRRGNKGDEGVAAGILEGHIQRHRVNGRREISSDIGPDDGGPGSG